MEINYEVEGLKEFVVDTLNIFTGIDSVIKELEKEEKSLVKEVDQLTSDTTYDIKIIKRKPLVEKELSDIRLALTEARSNRVSIAEKEMDVIDGLENEINRKYFEHIKAQKLQLEQEIAQLILETKNKIKEVSDITVRANSFYNSNVVYPINEIFDLSGNRRVLNIENSNFTKELSERI